MVNAEKTFTRDQLLIVREYEAVHGLDPSQISFDGQDLTPIFDFPAASYLCRKLTDIRDLDARIVGRDRLGRSTANCKVTLPEGSSRSVEGSAMIGETLGNGEHIDSVHFADSMAQARAARLAIRSIGIHLHLAHKQFVKNGGKTKGDTSLDPRIPLYQEIHLLAENLDLIRGSDRTEYRLFIANMFEGRDSSKDLNDIELQKLVATLRQLDKIRRSQITGQKLAA